MQGYKIGITIVALSVLGVGGYFANRAYQCHSLETEYLNAMANIRGTLAINATINNPELATLMETRQELSWKAAENALLGIYERCGKEAAETANRKGQDMLIGMI